MNALVRTLVPPSLEEMAQMEEDDMLPLVVSMLLPVCVCVCVRVRVCVCPSSRCLLVVPWFPLPKL